MGMNLFACETKEQVKREIRKRKNKCKHCGFSCERIYCNIKCYRNYQKANPKVWNKTSQEKNVTGNLANYYCKIKKYPVVRKAPKGTDIN
jgi:hypothetical protein